MTTNTYRTISDDGSITYGVTSRYSDEFRDGYQAFFAGKDKRSNPYKKKIKIPKNIKFG
jgi:hypothetical protein